MIPRYREIVDLSQDPETGDLHLVKGEPTLRERAGCVILLTIAACVVLAAAAAVVQAVTR